jgi:hypothetical protein
MAAIIDMPGLIPAQRALAMGWPLFWDDGGAVHSCTGFELHPGITLLMTLCDKDVPADVAFTDARAVVTCPACAELLERGPYVI